MSDSNFISAISQSPSLGGDESQPELAELAKSLSGGNDNLQQILTAIIANSPYLAKLLNNHPKQVKKLFVSNPDKVMKELIRELRQITATDQESFAKSIRQIKTKYHLSLALLDICGVWNTSKITSSLSKFADKVIQITARFCWQMICQHNKAPLPSLSKSGFFIIAFGKLGGSELNYSSDVDLAFFFQRKQNPDELEIDPRVFIRLAREITNCLSDVSEFGYVFRVDLRLRPDPSSTPIVLSTDAALVYYESVGQTWERAAWIKARVIAANVHAGEDFIKQMKPFIWRKNLDFAAIEDIHQIRQQVLFGKDQPKPASPGYNVKLGVGGIREIELFAQTLQLIHGGRKPELREKDTISALVSLSDTGLIPETTSSNMIKNYTFLRRVEHALQMVNDRQTHVLPDCPQQQQKFQRLLGFSSEKEFEKELLDCTSEIASLTKVFFAKDTSQKPKDALHLSGFENHPEAIALIEHAGFINANEILTRMRIWMSGQIKATRSERSRRLLVALAPEIINSLAKTPDPDAAFNSFAQFFEALPAGVQILSLFANSPGLLTRLVDIFQMAPKLGAVLTKRPNILEALIISDSNHDLANILRHDIAKANDIEQAMNIARRGVQEAMFNIGAELLTGNANPQEIAQTCSALAATTIDGLAQQVSKQLCYKTKTAPANWVVLAFGKLGSFEMMPGSDLDIMVLYTPVYEANNTPPVPPAEVWAARFTRRLISALSAPTEEGLLYEVDMRLRPSGQSGPIAVEINSFLNYYQKTARTWEFQALSRAQIISASSQQFASQAQQVCQRIISDFTDKSKVISEVSKMRKLLHSEKPSLGLWDIKNGPGGLTELEFIMQTISLLSPEISNFKSFFQTPSQQNQVALAKFIDTKQFEQLLKAHRLYHGVLQITNMALGRIGTSNEIPKRLRLPIITSTKTSSFSQLEEEIQTCRQQISAVLDHVLKEKNDGKTT
ncbi:MAG: bifunctional [glutamine synthetase] adenylyltransferase/[glutamine synthetase]-adenylyl-L-tyrosine phosphorylase [Robiginitomaculum sp.]|nr:bifunctional [glutamine synthetase] adenylyltransferase/[glutamine synthetase]-adenylyl-L-tyrosine phosphorylase [Robiginitomaculum sp.]